MYKMTGNLLVLFTLFDTVHQSRDVQGAQQECTFMHKPRVWEKL